MFTGEQVLFMRVVKIILAAIGSVLAYCILGWLALYLCVILGIWGAVPDIILILSLVYVFACFWQLKGIKWGKVWLGISMFLFPVLVLGALFGILQYEINVNRLEPGWLARLPIILESLSAFICAGLSGVIFLILLWIQRKKKSE